MLHFKVDPVRFKDDRQGLAVLARNSALFTIQKCGFETRGIKLISCYDVTCPSDHGYFAASLSHAYEVGIRNTAPFISPLLIEDPKPLANQDPSSDALEMFLQETVFEDGGEQDDLLLRWHGGTVLCGALVHYNEQWKSAALVWSIKYHKDERKWPLKEQALTALIEYSAPRVAAALFAIHPQAA